MTTVKRRRSIFIASIVALLLLAVGLFGVLFTRPKKIVAYAAESSSEQFYFHAGAQAGLTGWNLYQLRYRIYCSTDIVTDNAVVKIYFAQEPDSATKFAENEDIDLEVPLSKFSTSGSLAYYDVTVSADLTSTIQLEAEYYDPSIVAPLHTSTSDERSIVYVWRAFADNGYVMPSGEVLSESSALRQTIDQALVDPTSVSEVMVGKKVNLSDYKMQLNVILPSYVREEFAKGVTRTNSSFNSTFTGRKHYEYLSLNIYRTTDTITSERVADFSWDELPAGIQKNGMGVLNFYANVGGTYATTEYRYYAQIDRATYYVDTSWGKSEWSDVTYTLWEDCRSNYTDPFTARALAQEIVSREDIVLDSHDREWLNVVAGVSTDTEELPVVVKYKTSADGGYTVTDGTEVFNCSKSLFFRKAGVLHEMGLLTEFDDVSDFNVIGTYAYEKSEGGYDNLYETEKKIILTADGYEYEVIYDGDGIPVHGELTVTYLPYNYKDLAIRVTTLDVNKQDRYTLDYYTSRAVDNGTTVKLTYRYSEIQNNLLNGCGWIFTPAVANISVTVPQDSGITVAKTSEELVVTCPKSATEDLINLDMRLLTDIEKDYACTMTYRYLVLTQDGATIQETTVQSDELSFMYSALIQLNHVNFMNRFGEVVELGCNPSFLQGVQYCTPVDIRKVEKSRETHTDENGDVVVDSAVYEIIVEYAYDTIFAIQNNLDDTVTYKALSDTSLIYYGTQIVDEIPDGYRVKSITSSHSGLRITPNAKTPDDYTKTKLQVLIDTNTRAVLPISVEYTDKWHVVVEYLQEYADLRIRTGQSATPCFAQAMTYEGEVRVADYADIYALTAENVRVILGADKIDIMGLATVDTVTVTYDNISTYTVQLSYTYAMLKATNYDGESKEIKIPLSSYADWCDGLGQEWSILWLNTSGRRYFQYSNDVAREDLYGFFSVAVFDHHVSDLNYWFRETEGSGFVSVYESTEVQGSKLYKNLYRIRDKLRVAPTTTMAMGVSELINDDNKMVHSHFFYLDGTTNMSYLGENDPDDYDDTDGALGNQIQDGIDSVKDLWNDITNSPFFQAVKTVVAVFAILILIILGISIGRRIYNWANSGTKNKKK